MNDFTKEELECIENALQLQLSERAMSQINFDRRVQLRAKLQYMIDNYCEHKIGGYLYNCECQGDWVCDGCAL